MREYHTSGSVGEDGWVTAVPTRLADAPSEIFDEVGLATLSESLGEGSAGAANAEALARCAVEVIIVPMRW
jgi:hypothetical protein